MSRKTLALVLVLVGTTALLLLIAIRGEKKTVPTNTTPSPEAMSPTPNVPVETVLAMTPNPVSLDASGNGKVDVTIDSGVNDVQGIQLEMTYDPNALTNIKVTPGTFLKDPVVLMNTIHPDKGTISYWIGITPTQKAVRGTGTVATISFSKKSTASDMAQTEIKLTPQSQIGAAGDTISVLKSATGATVLLKSSQ